MTPDVSVIIPSWNRASLLREAIDSVLSQHASGLPLQVIVTDDASTDDTSSLLESYEHSICVVRHETNQGQCAARNHGLEQARGRYVKFLDSDDVLCDRSLSEEVALADATGADIVVSGWITTTIGVDGREIESSRRSYPAPQMEPMPDALLWGEAVPTSSALYRAHSITGLQWDLTVRKLDDWDWFCMAALRSRRIVSRQGVAYVMRAHGGTRVTSSSSMLMNALDHHRILGKVEAWLEARGQLTDARKRRLAQYYYKGMRVLSLHDRRAFEAGARKIRELDGRFVPRDEERQWWMRWFAAIVGFRRAILCHTFLKTVLKGSLPARSP